MISSPPSPAERTTALAVALIAAALLVTAVFGGAPPRTEAAAPEPTPALAYLIATPTPAASQRDVAPIAQQPLVQQATAAPVQAPVTAGAAVEPAAPEPPAPAAQIVYQADGSAVLPGVDGGAAEQSEPVSAEQSAHLAADAQLYKNLPVAGAPPTNPRPLMIKHHGNR